MADLHAFEIPGGDLPEWLDAGPYAGKERHRQRAIRKGKRRFQVAVRLEPEVGHLYQLSEAVSRLSGRELLREPTHEDRSLLLFFEHFAPDPAKAIDGVYYRRVRGWLKQIDIPIVRVSYDTREVPA